MVMDKLYGENCSCCHVCEPCNTAEYATLFTPELMAQLLADIFAGKFDVGREIYPALYETCRDTFRRALDEGYPLPEGADDAETLFREALRSDADVFAAFRTHRMQNDIASQLLDEDGKLKEWRQFREDAEAVIGTYNNHWLRTEYDTAVLRARQAADWKGFERNADILPNLKWMPTTSAEPDLFHREYWRIGLTLPIGHPFWKSHHPGDRWNCKCSLEATDEPVTGTIPRTDYNPSNGLENNPGTDAKLFSGSHPYYEKAYPGAEDAVKDLMHYTVIPTKSGMLRIHEGHGKHERDENIRIGKYLAEKHGYEIDLLNNPQNRKSADSYNRTLEMEQEYKLASTPTVNAIDRLIRDGRKQADNIVLWLDVDMPWEDVTAALRSRVRRCENIQSITIVHDNEDIMLGREDILADGFKIRPADLK